jgi:hypothetical protein
MPEYGDSRTLFLKIPWSGKNFLIIEKKRATILNSLSFPFTEIYYVLQEDFAHIIFSLVICISGSMFYAKANYPG